MNRGYLLPGFLIFTLLAILLGGAQSYAQDKKDTLVFYHGQMVLGKLHGIAQGYFEFDSDIARVIRVKNYKVYTFSASLHQYRIRTVDGQFIYCTLHKSDKEGFVEVRETASEKSYILPIEDIIELDRFDGKFSKRITGDFSFGYNFTKSSEIGRLNVSFSLDYHARKFQSNLTGNSIMTQENGDFSRDTENLVSTNIYSFSFRWLGIGLLSYQRNLELGILRRYQEGLLFGYNLVNHRNRQLITGIGVAVNQEITVDEGRSQNLVEIPFIIGFTLFKLDYPSIQLKVNQKMSFGITDKGRIRDDMNFTLDWKIIKDFKVTLNLYGNFDNQSSESSGNFDYGAVLGIGYTFW